MLSNLLTRCSPTVALGVSTSSTTRKKTFTVGCSSFHGTLGTISAGYFPIKRHSRNHSLFLLYFFFLNYSGINVIHSFKSESEMMSVCENDEQCMFDAKAMGNLRIGEATKHAHRYYKLLDQNMKPGKYSRKWKWQI